MRASIRFIATMFTRAVRHYENTNVHLARNIRQQLGIPEKEYDLISIRDPYLL